jgi:hypothetical protein
LQERVHLIQRPRARHIDEDEPVQVQDKPLRVLCSDRQQAGQSKRASYISAIRDTN